MISRLRVVPACLLTVLVAACAACTSGSVRDATRTPTGTSVPTSVVSRAVPRGWRTERSGGLVVHYPPAWVATRYTGAPATVVAPLFYLGERRVGRTCGSDRPSGGGTECFDGTWHVPASGLIIRWSESELLDPEWYRRAPGRATPIAGRVAKLYSGPPQDCAPGARSEVSADINRSTEDYAVRHTSQDYVVTACLGPHVPTTERAAVYTMIATIRIAN